MPSPRPAHRASTLERRDALLAAALEVVAERGVGATTHRLVAARAGVPLSTTSYFFGSIDELLLEALRTFAARSITRLEAATAAMVEHDLAPDAAIDAFVALLLAVPETELVAQFEAYVEASRRPELRADLIAVLDAFQTPVRAALAAAGVARADEAARAFVALVDGFALHRVVRGAGPQGDAQPLREALRLLLAAYAAAPTD